MRAGLKTYIILQSAILICSVIVGLTFGFVDTPKNGWASGITLWLILQVILHMA